MGTKDEIVELYLLALRDDARVGPSLLKEVERLMRSGDQFKSDEIRKLVEKYSASGTAT